MAAGRSSNPCRFLVQINVKFSNFFFGKKTEEVSASSTCTDHKAIPCIKCNIHLLIIRMDISNVVEGTRIAWGHKWWHNYCRWTLKMRILTLDHKFIKTSVAFWPSTLIALPLMVMRKSWSFMGMPIGFTVSLGGGQLGRFDVGQLGRYLKCITLYGP